MGTPSCLIKLRNAFALLRAAAKPQLAIKLRNAFALLRAAAKPQLAIALALVSATTTLAQQKPDEAKPPTVETKKDRKPPPEADKKAPEALGPPSKAVTPAVLNAILGEMSRNMKALEIPG